MVPLSVPLGGTSAGARRGPARTCTEEDHVTEGLRSLLRATSRADAARTLQAVITRLGGLVVDARDAGEDAIPADVSLGVGKPLLVEPRTDTDARSLAAQVALLLEDARWAAARCDLLARETARARVDALTEVATRAEIGPRLALAGDDDVVCLLDVDEFKRLNDRGGHAAGDRALRDLGARLAACTRPSDFVGRYGGDEFLLLLPSTPLPVAVERMEALRERWSREGHGTTVSIGIAVVAGRGGPEAVLAADRALYLAKRAGRNRVEIAGPDGQRHAGA
jgi:diguanylate cyclase (GGDEF)-like protein